ncbi:hypothetical protein H2248_008202 [Termitomyces sp. 'cryptogamus']|nr:hypothetical protein H2248_008202 [Termitomyces sp. 'cryptogamus']
MATTFHSPIPLDSKLGAAFLGNLVAGIFYGITCVQAYMYFIKNSRKDEPWFKGIIFFLWLLDTVHLAFITHGLYVYMVSNFGNLAALAAPPWSLLAQIYVTCISDAIVRCIFGRRVWLMTRRNYFLVICIALTSTCTFVTGVAFATRAFSLKEFKHFSKISYFLYTSLGSGVAADLLIAGSLCFSLSQRKTGFKKTDSLVTVLIMYTINTSLLTTICSAACFITYTIWPNEFTFIGIYFSLSKLFLNSLLATLNGRDSLSGKLGGVSNVSQLSNMDSDFSFKPSQSRRGPSVLVSIDRQVVKDYEMESTHKGLAI